jgi:hypothetical protein
MPDIDDFYHNDTTTNEDASLFDFDTLNENAKHRLLKFLQEVLLPPEAVESILYKSLVNQTSEEYATYVRNNVYGTFNPQSATKIDFQARLAMSKTPKTVKDLTAYLKNMEPHIRHLEQTASRFNILATETQDEAFEYQDIPEFTALINIVDYALSLMKALEIIKTLSSKIGETSS